MAAGTDTTPCQGKLDNGFCKENKKLSNNEKKIQEDSDQAKVARPPVMRHCISQETFANIFPLECPTEIGLNSTSRKDSGFLLMFRSGSCSEIGPKPFMEDEYICVDNLCEHLGTANGFPSPGAFYGVFDGHGGVDAASFTRKNILNFIIEDFHFPNGVKRAVKNAFVKVDNALADDKNLDHSSGTTALTAIMLGRTMIIANAGDSRAVLGRRGRAIELSKDHKPNCTSEKLRIEELGGVIYDGYLNGQLSVARALGDWHMKGPKGTKCPLSSEPEIEELILTEEDEFLIIGCDGLWDVMSSQYAVTVVRKELMMHNDPEKCCKDLVREALKRNTCDNLTVVVICFSPDPPPRIEIPKSQKRRSISAEGLDVLKEILTRRPVAATIKLRIPAGGAKPAPPVGPALGQYRLNLMSFCKDFNARTQKYKPDAPMAVSITAFQDNTFEFTVKSPSVSWFLKKAAGIESGSSRPGHVTATTITLKHVYEIAKIKQSDPYCQYMSLEAISKSIIGTANSMGIKVLKELD